MSVDTNNSVRNQDDSRQNSVEEAQSLETKKSQEKGIDQIQAIVDTTFEDAHWKFFVENVDPDLRRDLREMSSLSDYSVAALEEYIKEKRNPYEEWKADCAQDELRQRILDNQSGKVTKFTKKISIWE